MDFNTVIVICQPRQPMVFMLYNSYVTFESFLYLYLKQSYRNLRTIKSWICKELYHLIFLNVFRKISTPCWKNLVTCIQMTNDQIGNYVLAHRNVWRYQNVNLMSSFAEKQILQCQKEHDKMTMICKTLHNN
jgi:hypothetical protein